MSTHFDVVDGDGNAETQSLGSGGSGVMMGDTGMFLNPIIPPFAGGAQGIVVDARINKRALMGGLRRSEARWICDRCG